MIKTTMLVIVPKDNHDALTCWCFAPEDRELAEQVLEEQFPDGTHEIIETDCEMCENIEEEDFWAFNRSW